MRKITLIGMMGSGKTTIGKILSLGGGTFENEQTRELLLKNSTVIYLETTPEEIFKRIQKTNNRPLLKNNMTIEKISEIIAKRKNNYNLAHHKILTDGKTPSKIAEEILGALEWKN